MTTTAQRDLASPPPRPDRLVEWAKRRYRRAMARDDVHAALRAAALWVEAERLDAEFAPEAAPAPARR